MHRGSTCSCAFGSWHQAGGRRRLEQESAKMAPHADKEPIALPWESGVIGACATIFEPTSGLLAGVGRIRQADCADVSRLRRRRRLDSATWTSLHEDAPLA